MVEKAKVTPKNLNEVSIGSIFPPYDDFWCVLKRKTYSNDWLFISSKCLWHNFFLQMGSEFITILFSKNIILHYIYTYIFGYWFVRYQYRKSIITTVYVNLISNYLRFTLAFSYLRQTIWGFESSDPLKDFGLRLHSLNLFSRLN